MNIMDSTVKSRNNGMSVQKNNTDTQTQHDFHSALRFFENLYEEILYTDDISTLKDPAVLKKFQENIVFIKKTFDIK